MKSLHIPYLLFTWPETFWLSFRYQVFCHCLGKETWVTHSQEDSVAGWTLCPSVDFSHSRLTSSQICLSGCKQNHPLEFARSFEGQGQHFFCFIFSYLRMQLKLLEDLGPWQGSKNGKQGNGPLGSVTMTLCGGRQRWRVPSSRCFWCDREISL